MSIPKVIYQTFKSNNLPFVTRWHIRRIKKRNPLYKYEFFDDKRIIDFIGTEFGDEILTLYKRIDIGAAKADFFRYAILFKKGGIYLDIDSLLVQNLDSFILPDDEAIISLESNNTSYVQWALIYSPGHSFLKKTLDIVIENLKLNKYPNDVHKMTGPSAYTEAINSCLIDEVSLHYRLMGIDYSGCFKFHYSMSKFFLYSSNQHWRKAQLCKPILKDN